MKVKEGKESGVAKFHGKILFGSLFFQIVIFCIFLLDKPVEGENISSLNRTFLFFLKRLVS